MADDRDRQALTLAVFTKLSRAHASLSAVVQAVVASDSRLQGSGFPILEVLYHKGSLPQCDIGRKILRTTGNISQAVDRLEQQGLVSRQPGPDRRTHSIELTKAGRALIAEVFPRVARALGQAMSGLDDKELQVLGQLARQLGLTAEASLASS